MSDIFDTLVEVTLKNPDDKADFLKVKETLTRIGIASKSGDKLYQSCHILHKQGRYYIVHFLEMFQIDGKGNPLSEEDLARRNTIANLLAEWGLVTLVDPTKTTNPVASMRTIRVVAFKDKNNWELVPKYRIGGK
jgi:hypothetical protein